MHEIGAEVRVQSKGRLRAAGVTVVLERPFDYTRRQTLVNLLGYTRVPLRVLFQSGERRA